MHHGPQFVRTGPILDPAQIRKVAPNYPHHDAMFPSVVATDALHNARGKYYCYFGPHDPPGGIYLAVADDPAGPWRPRTEPVIRRVWPGRLSVDHVASPHALWVRELGRLILWFHGPNWVTHWAASDDGIHFEYGGVSLQDTKPATVSYARVFRSLDGFLMIYMRRDTNGIHHLHAAHSTDAVNFQEAGRVLRSQRGHYCGGWLWRGLLIYHHDLPGHVPGRFTANLVCREFDPLTLASGDERVFYEAPLQDTPRVASACILEQDLAHLYYDAGPRLSNSICHAVLRP
ncbi:Glycosyl hydrolases family 43 [Posidoniimonas corsicana]|uniref:Glycosyl hydrolases family 43 n=1 Tax=Posidoniimonas corsicana TaxID=1938618 RepID=A0A5C5VB50_9BACT|nr:Glycosyl hydrolases family 43 [Posidoniimonas corsicana]